MIHENFTLHTTHAEHTLQIPINSSRATCPDTGALHGAIAAAAAAALPAPAFQVPRGLPAVTFSGTSEFSTVVPLPTSLTTIVVAAGESIVLAAGGTIVGSLPPGISEVGGNIPVAAPGPGDSPPDTASPTQTSSDTDTDSQSSFSSSSASASSSAPACYMPPQSPCGSACFGPTGIPNEFQPDLDLDDKTDSLTGDFCGGDLKKGLFARSNGRDITSSSACRHISSPPRRLKGRGYFDFDSTDKNSFTVTSRSIRSTPSLAKSNVFRFSTFGYLTCTTAEHVFEFQVFSQFMKYYMLNNRKTINGCNWLERFYNPKKGVVDTAQKVVNRIDDMRNLGWVCDILIHKKFNPFEVFAHDYINTAKLYTIGEKYNSAGETGLTSGFNVSAPNLADRVKIAGLIRGFGAVPNCKSYFMGIESPLNPLLDLNQNADAFKKYLYYLPVDNKETIVLSRNIWWMIPNAVYRSGLMTHSCERKHPRVVIPLAYVKYTKQQCQNTSVGAERQREERRKWAAESDRARGNTSVLLLLLVGWGIH
ncbi:hypothetical protein C8R43DRAFT_959147 [Mycena crocata]|nr:hypothetical protein C8R43DRAFT_959147 [Mycena crocata]